MLIRLMKETDTDAVLKLWQDGCLEAVGHYLPEKSAQQVHRNLNQYLEHPQCFCFVVEYDTTLIGFTSAALLNHPVQPGFMGEIEELYVQPPYRTAQLLAQLVEQAVIALKAQGAGVITTRISVDESDALAFWRNLNWVQDTVNFTIYSDVPGDSTLQAVWDRYHD